MRTNWTYLLIVVSCQRCFRLRLLMQPCLIRVRCEVAHRYLADACRVLRCDLVFHALSEVLRVRHLAVFKIKWDCASVIVYWGALSNSIYALLDCRGITLFLLVNNAGSCFGLGIDCAFNQAWLAWLHRLLLSCSALCLLVLRSCRFEWAWAVAKPLWFRLFCPQIVWIWDYRLSESLLRLCYWLRLFGGCRDRACLKITVVVW